MKTSLNNGKSIDFRSLVIGLLVGMIVLMASGHESGQQRFMGRYIPISAGNSDTAIFIIDAYTGQTWRMDEAATVDYGIPELRDFPETDMPER